MGKPHRKWPKKYIYKKGRRRDPLKTIVVC
jgi:hypothetical protein